MATVEERLAALEQAVTELRQKQTDTHTLAAHADRDVAEFRDELRDQTKLINLTRLDMSELQDDMGELRDETTELRVEMNQRFAEVNAGLTQIVDMLGRLSGGQE